MYIRIYKPYIDVIKLIRSIRICSTPALGGTLYLCENCNKKHHVFLSCGNTHCMICQGLKRRKWKDKLSAKLLNVPYAHITFTLPKQINFLAKNNQCEIYNLLMRSSWKTIKSLSAFEKNLGARPGMISVLHTWGSDLKYHIHTHCLVTFGGLDNHNNWKWPKRRNKMAPFRKLSQEFKKIFLADLKILYKKGKIEYRLSYDQIEELVENKRWVVNHQRPTIDTEHTEKYLAKYICRSAVTANRLHYDHKTQMVSLLYNDYSKQEEGQAAPKAYRKMFPLDAIHQIVQHKLPPYFQRSRYNGLHSSVTYKAIKDKIDPSLKRNTDTIKLLFSLLAYMNGLPIESKKHKCPFCGSQSFSKSIIQGDRLWPILNIAHYYANKSPPKLSIPKTYSMKQL